MASWYCTIKTIKGRRYIYEQRTWREGGRVRAESRYIGPAGGKAENASDPSESVNLTSSVVYHGSRLGLEGPPRASDDGTFGPGFYLTTKARARDYAIYDGKTAARLPGSGGALPLPQYDGIVYACDMRHMTIKPMSWDGYYALMETLLGLAPGDGIPTPDNKRRVTELLVGQGYDGIQIIDELRQETVIFPASLHKITLKPLITVIVDK